VSDLFLFIFFVNGEGRAVGLITVTVHTLAKFGSLVLVTVTVTRKMLSMIFSVVAFGHSLSKMQMVGVGLVFSGIGAEAEIKRRSELAKKTAASANGHVKKE
jgi:UDP-galactose transporter B1